MRLALLLSLLPLSSASAQDEARSEEPEETRSFEESVRDLAPIRIEAGRQGYRIELEVHRWGDPEADFEAEIAIASTPPFLGDVRLVEGSSLVIPAGETSSTVTIRFDAIDATGTEGAGAEGSLQVSISPGDELFVPATRVLEIPFDLRTKEDPLLLVHALREDAPEEFPFQDAIDHCDTELADVLVHDRVALFFTPARDLGVPLEERSFMWRIRRRSDGERVSRGGVVFIRADGSELERMPFAKEGSPARFVVLLDPWHWGSGVAGTETFVLETTDAKSVYTGLLGAEGSDTWVPADDDWQEEGTFELGNKRLHFVGFTFERVENVRLPLKAEGEEPREWYGRLDMVEAKEGARVDLDLRVRAPNVDGRSRLSLHFPEELDPGGPTMGTVLIDGDAPEDYAMAQWEFAGLPGTTTVFTAAMRPLLPLGELPEHPRGLWGDDPPVAWGGIERGGTIKTWNEEVEKDRTTIHDGLGRLGDAGRPRAFESTAELELSMYTDPPDGKRGASGAPARSLAGHLHAPGTRWVLPVVVHFARMAKLGVPPPPAPYVTTHGYAIYAAEAGADEGTHLAHAQSGTGEEAGTPTGDPSELAADVERAKEELSAAETEAARAREMAEAGAISQTEADAAEARRVAVAEKLAEAERRKNAAEEGTDPLARTEQPAETEQAREVPDVTGSLRAAAEKALEEEGFVAEVTEGAPAPSTEDEGRVERQDPPAGTSLERGEPVSVVVFGPPEPEEEVVRGWVLAQRLGPPMGVEYVSGQSSLSVDEDENTVHILVSDWEYVGTWSDPSPRLEPGDLVDLALDMRAVTVGGADRDTCMRVTSGGGVSFVKDMGTCRPTQASPHVSTVAKIQGPSDSYHELRIEVSARPWSSWTYPLATYVYERASSTHRDETWVRPGQLRIPLPVQIGPYKRSAPAATLGMSSSGWPGDAGHRSLTIDYKSGKEVALTFEFDWRQEGDEGDPSDLCGASWSALGPNRAEARSPTKQARVRVTLAHPGEGLALKDLQPFAENFLRMIERAALPCR